MPEPSHCRARRERDGTYYCSHCKVRWDADEPNPCKVTESDVKQRAEEAKRFLKRFVEEG